MTVHITSLTLLFILLSSLAYVWYRGRIRSSKLPPGPRPLPLIGNVHQLPLKDQHKTFAEWGREYGDLIYLRIFATPVLVVHSLSAARELLEGKNSVTSDRPHMVFVREFLGYDSCFPFIPYGETWRQQRKWVHTALETKESLASYSRSQRRAVHALLSDLLDKPERYPQPYIKRRFMAAMMMEIVYGHTMTSEDDAFVRAADEAIDETVKVGAIASLVYFLPILRRLPSWLPGMGFKKKTLRIRQLVQKTMDEPFEMARKTMINDHRQSCFVARIISSQSEGRLLLLDQLLLKYAAGALYMVLKVVNQTATTLSTFLLAMVLHPEVLRKAQAEIDRVVGGTRLPNVEDRASLPYVDCIIKEVYRWNCPAPSGKYRDVLRGHNIARGTVIVANLWAMTQDSTLYPEPGTFRPERFQEMDSHTAEQADPRKFIFGFGRRICPGRHFADVTIWLTIASIIAAFDISKARDAEGNEIMPRMFFTSGLVSLPEPFECDIRPRTTNTQRLISQLSENPA
ncbi:hypothetical protein POSPLADRAFT_1177392 [Postia placenta MAD-698-R-SB12]|uniref:Cytochrome P450 n=1 Tax=Postia placenta MAD-698-R-SB12 TaxID=670580 RepID=A0A1X6NBC1_9APHY|nr:hypothetical protein POSPLADRAFT_1177392 [Postia placenta MAD-698-R-SB12]OSX65938.1 hypothetical protein POSPLADRAFT_1177392 [Postia placenta MAD-698-R-SB12]